jgi:hypothetical protein
MDGAPEGWGGKHERQEQEQPQVLRLVSRIA